MSNIFAEDDLSKNKCLSCDHAILAIFSIFVHLERAICIITEILQIKNDFWREMYCLSVAQTLWQILGETNFFICSRKISLDCIMCSRWLGEI